VAVQYAKWTSPYPKTLKKKKLFWTVQKLQRAKHFVILSNSYEYFCLLHNAMKWREIDISVILTVNRKLGLMLN
jgi:hypothetical protein